MESILSRNYLLDEIANAKPTVDLDKSIINEANNRFTKKTWKTDSALGALQLEEDFRTAAADLRRFADELVMGQSEAWRAREV